MRWASRSMLGCFTVNARVMAADLAPSLLAETESKNVDDSNQEMMDFSPRSGQERTALVMTMLGKLRRRKACGAPQFGILTCAQASFGATRS